jgi:hypothetical protein
LLLLLLQVAYSYGHEEKPAWLTTALHRPGKQALPLSPLVVCI